MYTTCHITCWTLSMDGVQFIHGVFDVFTGTEPRQGHRWDQENDGDVQRKEGCSFLNIRGLPQDLPRHLELRSWNESLTRTFQLSVIASESNGHWTCEKKESGKWNWCAKHSKWFNLLNHITTCRLHSVKKKRRKKSTRMCCIYALVALIKTVFMCKYLNMSSLKFCWAPCENQMHILHYCEPSLNNPWACSEEIHFVHYILFALYSHLHLYCDNIDWLKHQPSNAFDHVCFTLG